VHETLHAGGLGWAFCGEPIAQVPFRDLSQMLSKMKRYSTLGVPAPGSAARAPSMWRRAACTEPPRSCATMCSSWHAGRLAGFVIAFANFEGTFYDTPSIWSSSVKLVREPQLPHSLHELNQHHDFRVIGQACIDLEMCWYHF